MNLRYKIPRATFLSRLKVFWSNCIIVRRLYEALYPGHELDFLGFDQKPLWFNSIMSERTYAFKGSTKVAVAENVSASRARFTAMTQCKTWLDQAVGGLQPDPEDAEVIWDTSAPLVMGGSQGDDGLQPGDLFDGAATDPSDLQPEDLFDEGATGPSGQQPGDLCDEVATGPSGLQPAAPEQPSSATKQDQGIGLAPHIAVLFKVGEATCSVDKDRKSVV